MYFAISFYRLPILVTAWRLDDCAKYLLVHRVRTLLKTSLTLERKISKMTHKECIGGPSHVFCPWCITQTPFSLQGWRPPGELNRKAISSYLGNPSCKVFTLLPPSSNSSYELRKQRRFAQPMVCRKRKYFLSEPTRFTKYLGSSSLLTIFVK